MVSSYLTTIKIRAQESTALDHAFWLGQVPQKDVLAASTIK